MLHESIVYILTGKPIDVVLLDPKNHMLLLQTNKTSSRKAGRQHCAEIFRYLCVNARHLH